MGSPRSPSASPNGSRCHELTMQIFGGTLARYFGLRCLRTVLLVFVSIFLLVMLIDYIELMRRSSDIPGVSPLLVAKTSFYRVPQVTERIMAFCMLIGTMICYLDLSRRLELVVARVSRRVGLAIHCAGAGGGLHSRRRGHDRLQSAVRHFGRTLQALRSRAVQARLRRGVRQQLLDQPTDQRRSGHHQRQDQP